jgi:hypothetical protein
MENSLAVRKSAEWHFFEFSGTACTIGAAGGSCKESLARQGLRSRRTRRRERIKPSGSALKDSKMIFTVKKRVRFIEPAL